MQGIFRVGIYILAILSAYPGLQLPGLSSLPNLANLWGLGLFSLFLLRALLTGKKIKMATLPTVLFIVFLLFALLSTLNSPSPLYSLQQFVNLIILFFVYIVMLPNLISSVQIANRTIAVMIGIGLISAILGIYTRQTESHAHTVVAVGWMGYNGNALADYLSGIVPLAIAVTCFGTNRRRHFLLIGATLLLSYALVFTFSRSGLLAFCTSLLPIIILRYGDRVNLLRIFATLSLLGVLSVSGFYLYTTIIIQGREGIMVTNSEINSKDSADDERLTMWYIGFDMVTHHPFIGSGLGTFRLQTEKDVALLYNYDAHGLVLKLLAETGLLGFFSFMGFIFSIFYRAWIVARATHRQHAFAIAIFASLSGLFLFNMFGTRYFFPQFWFIIGMAIAVRWIPVGERVEDQAIHRIDDNENTNLHHQLSPA